MGASLRDLRLLASVAALSVLALSACTTSSPPVEQAAPAPVAQPAIPSRYHPEEVVGRWGYGAYHNDADLARTTAAARSQCGQPVVITRGPGGGVMMYLADSAELQELQLKGSQNGKNYIGPPGDAGGPHVPGDLITSDVVASTAGCFPQFTGTVDAIVVFPKLPQRRTDDLVAAGSR